MTHVIRKLLVGFCSLLYVSCAQASQFGASFSIPLIKKDPVDLHGYRVAVTYQPKTFEWKHWSIYFDASFGHWWVNEGPYRTINSYAIAPYFRFYLIRNFISPYIEASIGPTFLTKTRIADRNQGIHYSFQDQVAIGATIGKEQRFFASLSALHYSNGSLSTRNAGITVYTMFNVGYRF